LPFQFFAIKNDALLIEIIPMKILLQRFMLESEALLLNDSIMEGSYGDVVFQDTI